MIKSINTKFSRSLFLLISFALFCCLSGCGAGGGDEEDPGTTPTTNAATLDLLVSSQALNSSGTPTVTLTAIVKDGSNRALAGQTVDFSATSGSIIVSSAITDASGQATATLSTGGDKSNRSITVTASCGSISNTNTVSVTGTSIEISGQNSIGYNTTATYTITLKDSAAVGIGSQTVTITSLYNTLSSSTITTNASGQGTITLTASDTLGREDTLTATAIGATAQITVQVNNADFRFISPDPNTEIPISTWTNVTIHYAISGVPQPGITVSFTSTRGTLSSSTAITDASGNAIIQIRDVNVGSAAISASVAAGPSAQLNVSFVATTPASMTLQADPSGISTNIGASTTQRSTLIATVRDAQNNLVKNQTIIFSLTKDPSGGYLSPAKAITDSAGRATVLYIAGPTDSGTNGVEIQAALQGTVITQTTTLTVGGISLFISIGTGPIITSLSDQTYQKNYDVMVTDAAGWPIKDANVTAILTPVAYLKGTWIQVPEGSSCYWNPINTLGSTHHTSLYPLDPALAGYNYCLNEDLQYWNDSTYTTYALNGIKDPGEDFNDNGKLDPGTIASVSPGTLITDSNGRGTFGVIYTKSYATWVFVRIDVTVKVGGTEGKASTTFRLPYAKVDYPCTFSMPPTPFGLSVTCADTL